jgi:membrane protein YqaA with SNARE-associated domain
VLEKSYRWALAKAGSPAGAIWLSVISFAESSFFPLPPDVLLVPMVLARRDQWFRLALLCTLTSVAGGVVGYGIGYFLYEQFGQAIIDFYHLEREFNAFQDGFREYGAWILVAKGMTPIPYKLLTITAGVAQLNFWVFVVASIVSRAARFFIVAYLLHRYGAPIQDFIETRLKLVSVLFLILVVGGVMLVKLV